MRLAALRKNIFLLISLSILLTYPSSVILHAQATAPHDSSKQIKDSALVSQNKKVPQKDLGDVFKKIFRVKPSFEDTLIKKDGVFYFLVLPGVSYSILTGFKALAATSLSFNLGKTDSANTSTVLGLAEYGQNGQLITSVISSIWSRKNKINFLGDWRYYDYASYTYGMGGHSSKGNSDLIFYDYLRISQLAVTQIIPEFMAGIGYNFDYHWHIRDGSGTPQNDYTQYGRTEKSNSSGLSLNILSDTRRNPNNPQRGHLTNLAFRQNITFLGSDKNWQSMFLDYRRYFRIPARSRNVLAIWNYYWFTLDGIPPYFDLPSTGWDTYSNSGRQFIQSRYRSTNMMYLETEYRFTITNNGLLGGLVFANLQSFSEWRTNKFETIAPGAGIGIRIKANKHADTNLVLSYGIGINGARGFLFNLGETF